MTKRKYAHWAIAISLMVVAAIIAGLDNIPTALGRPTWTRAEWSLPFAAGALLIALTLLERPKRKGLLEWLFLTPPLVYVIPATMLCPPGIFAFIGGDPKEAASDCVLLALLAIALGGAMFWLDDYDAKRELKRGMHLPGKAFVLSALFFAASALLLPLLPSADDTPLSPIVWVPLLIGTVAFTFGLFCALIATTLLPLADWLADRALQLGDTIATRLTRRPPSPADGHDTTAMPKP